MIVDWDKEGKWLWSNIINGFDVSGEMVGAGTGEYCTRGFVCGKVGSNGLVWYWSHIWSIWEVVAWCTGDGTVRGTGDRAGWGTGDRGGWGTGDRTGWGTGDRTGWGTGDRTGWGTGDVSGVVSV